MKKVQKVLQFLRILLFAFIFSVCMVMGTVMVIPKRKDEVVVEGEIVKDEKAADNLASFSE